MPSKSERHAAIRARAESAIRDLYHNATLPSRGWPDSDDDTCDSDTFESWLQQAAESEIDYLGSGGAYGKDYRRTLEAPCNAGRYKSPAARAFYVRRGMAKMQEERSRCNTLDSRKAQTNAMWEWIHDYGKLYQYGRGGRTLAPESLWRDGGAGHGPRVDTIADWNVLALVELTRVLESFNRAVAAWCEDVPAMWAEECAERRDERAEAEADTIARSRPDMHSEARA